MTWVIRIDRGRDGGIAWFTGHRAAVDEKDAKPFGTREDAEQIRELCGLYRILGWKTVVVPSVKVTVDRVPEVTRPVVARSKKQKPPVKRPKVKVDKRGQYSLF